MGKLVTGKPKPFASFKTHPRVFIISILKIHCLRKVYKNDNQYFINMISNNSKRIIFIFNVLFNPIRLSWVVSDTKAFFCLITQNPCTLKIPTATLKKTLGLEDSLGVSPMTAWPEQ